MVWGVSVVADVKRLDSDMHSYLAASGAPALRGRRPACQAEQACAYFGAHAMRQHRLA